MTTETTTTARAADTTTSSAARMAADAVRAAKQQPALQAQAQTDAQALQVARTGGSQQFDHVGVSSLNGKLRLRFTNNLPQRLRTFARDGDTDVAMLALPVPMTKVEGVKVALAHERFAENQPALELFRAFLTKHNAL